MRLGSAAGAQPVTFVLYLLTNLLILPFFNIIGFIDDVICKPLEGGTWAWLVVLALATVAVFF